jgi:hypothetical protein
MAKAAPMYRKKCEMCQKYFDVFAATQHQVYCSKCKVNYTVKVRSFVNRVQAVPAE